MNESLKLCGEIVVVSSLVGLAFIAGAFMSTEGELLERANVEGQCKVEPKFNAYIAQSSDGWHCFKENIDNGKLSRSAMVL
jgi:hypothetical protein